MSSLTKIIFSPFAAFLSSSFAVPAFAEIAPAIWILALVSFGSLPFLPVSYRGQ